MDALVAMDLGQSAVRQFGVLRNTVYRHRDNKVQTSGHVSLG